MQAKTKFDTLLSRDTDLCRFDLKLHTQVAVPRTTYVPTVTALVWRVVELSWKHSERQSDRQTDRQTHMHKRTTLQWRN